MRAVGMAALVVLFAAGCASKNAPAPPAEDPTDSEFSDGSNAGGNEGYAGSGTNVSNRDAGFAPVYFGLDSTQIAGEYRGALEVGAGALKAGGQTVIIEGHCDERGSEEYNFALGERRANSVRKYLYNLGVPMNQMNIVSYGEAQPSVSGYGESAWRLNRRAEFKLR